MNQICAAVRYLHSKNVCHRDLKFENIMFESKDENAMVILIDFGLSKAYKPGQVMSETVRVGPCVCERWRGDGHEVESEEMLGKKTRGSSFHFFPPLMFYFLRGFTRL